MHFAAVVIPLTWYSQIFEAAEIKTEVGAAVGVQANSLRVLDHLGVSRDNLKGVPWQKVGVHIFLEAVFKVIAEHDLQL